MAQKADPEADKEGGNAIPEHVKTPMAVPFGIGSQGIRVNSLKVCGNKKTAEEFVARLFSSALEANSFDSLQIATQEARQLALSLDIFRSVQVVVDTASGEADQHADGLRAVDLFVVIDELPSTSKSIGLSQDMRKAEKELSFTYLHKNLFGSAEKIFANAKLGTEFRRLSDNQEISLGLEKPLVFGRRLSATLTGSVGTDDWSHLCSFKELGRSLKAQLATEANRHTLAYQLTWRDLVPSASKERKQTPSASAVRAGALPSLKSSLLYMFQHHTVDQLLVPTSGVAVTVKAELAGLGGDVEYAKCEAQAATFIPFPSLHRQLSLRFGVNCGYMQPLVKSVNASLEGIPPPDLFFLGGPAPVRGFLPFALGPHDERDATGGNLFAALSCGLYFPLPFRAAQAVGVRGLAYVTSGNLVRTANQQWNGQPKSLRGFLQGFKWTSGLGVQIPTPMGRVGVNFSVPLPTSTKDDLMKHFQFSFSLSSNDL